MRWHRKDTYKCKLKRNVNEFRYGGKSVMGNDDADGLTTLKRPRMLPTFRASAQSIMAEINFNERRRTKKKKKTHSKLVEVRSSRNDIRAGNPWIHVSMAMPLVLSILPAAGGEAIAEGESQTARTQTMLIKIGKSCGKCVNSNYTATQCAHCVCVILTWLLHRC